MRLSFSKPKCTQNLCSEPLPSFQFIAISSRCAEEMSQMNTDNNKFLSLIQPIKDLAANWDIDIAENLNDYLEDLEQLKISLDGGQTQLNFAEAALLIQGSTTVYSKKVEYLYQLVLKSLEFITQKKSAPSKAGGNKAGAIKDQDNQSIEDDILNFGDDPSFLLLDHLVEEGQNIDMKPSQKAEMRDRMSSESVSLCIF